MINGTPQIVQLAVDFEKHLIKMPFVTGSCPPPASLVRILLATFLAPPSDRFIGEDDSTLGHQFFDIPIAEWKTEVQPNRVTDNLGPEAIALVAS